MRSKEEGFISTIILVVVALVLAKHFLNFDIYQFADSLWSRFLSPAVSIWHHLHPVS